jgi:hypothetical protein
MSDNRQTRQKLKEAYDLHFAATIERAEKQIILARYGRRLLNLLDDTPVVPGDVRQAFANSNEARQVLSDAEQELQQWQPNLEPIHTNAGGLGTNLMPTDDITTTATSEVGAGERENSPPHHNKPAAEAQGTHLEQAIAS